MATDLTRRQRTAYLLNRLSRRIAVYLAVLAGFSFLLLLALVCANAGSRAFGLPLRGAVESSGLLGALTAALALGYAQLHHNHITGGVAIQRLPCTFRLVLDALACLSGALFYSAAAWELLDLGLFTLETGETVDGAGELYPWFILLTVPGFVGQAVIMFLLFCTTLLNGDEKCPC